MDEQLPLLGDSSLLNHHNDFAEENDDYISRVRPRVKKRVTAVGGIPISTTYVRREHYAGTDDVVCVAIRLFTRHMVCTALCWVFAYVLAVISMAEVEAEIQSSTSSSDNNSHKGPLAWSFIPLTHISAIIYYVLIWLGCFCSLWGSYRAIHLMTQNSKVVPSEYRQIINSMTTTTNNNSNSSNSNSIAKGSNGYNNNNTLDYLRTGRSLTSSSSMLSTNLIDFKSLPLMRKVMAWCLLSVVTVVAVLISSMACARLTYAAAATEHGTFALWKLWVSLMPVICIYYLILTLVALSRSFSWWTVLAWVLVGIEAVLYVDRACGANDDTTSILANDMSTGAAANNYSLYSGNFSNLEYVPGVGLAAAPIWRKCRYYGGHDAYAPTVLFSPAAGGVGTQVPWLLLLSPLLLVEYITYARLLWTGYRSQWCSGRVYVSTWQTACWVLYLVALVLGLSVQIRFLFLNTHFHVEGTTAEEVGNSGSNDNSTINFNDGRMVLYGWAVSVLLFVVASCLALTTEIETLILSGGYKLVDPLIAVVSDGGGGGKDEADVKAEKEAGGGGGKDEADVEAEKEAGGGGGKDEADVEAEKEAGGGVGNGINEINNNKTRQQKQQQQQKQKQSHAWRLHNRSETNHLLLGTLPLIPQLTTAPLVLGANAGAAGAGADNPEVYCGTRLSGSSGSGGSSSNSSGSSSACYRGTSGGSGNKINNTATVTTAVTTTTAATAHHIHRYRRDTIEIPVSVSKSFAAATFGSACSSACTSPHNSPHGSPSLTLLASFPPAAAAAASTALSPYGSSNGDVNGVPSPHISARDHHGHRDECVGDLDGGIVLGSATPNYGSI